MRKLRDISEFATEECDLGCCYLVSPEAVAYLQRKISLAGEMKSAIRKLVDSGEPHFGGPNASYMISVRSRYFNQARKAMEAYLNCDGSSPE